MQKFRFALQPVLQKRKMAYEQASRKLAIAQKELQTEFQRLTDLQNQKPQLQSDLKYRKQHQGFKAAEWTTYVGYFQHLDQRIRSQALIIEEKEKQVDNLIKKYKHNLHILEFIRSVLVDDICGIRWWKSSNWIAWWR